VAYTSHGHHIPGTDKLNPPNMVARCGGIGRCKTCNGETLPVQVTGSTSKDNKSSDTEVKIYDVLRGVGVDPLTANEVITEFQKQGILVLFKEEKTP
jgi:hypothetical protein